MSSVNPAIPPPLVTDDYISHKICVILHMHKPSHITFKQNVYMKDKTVWLQIQMVLTPHTLQQLSHDITERSTVVWEIFSVKIFSHA